MPSVGDLASQYGMNRTSALEFLLIPQTSSTAPSITFIIAIREI